MNKISKNLTLGFSPCPNDTFIFEAMVDRHIDNGPYRFDCSLEDVETLNNWAFEERLDVTKLSYSAYLHLSDRYVLLDSGSALGKGVGPLLVRKEGGPLAGKQLDDFLATARMAIPGKNTTANLLCSMAFPQAVNKTEVLFSEIEDQVLSGAYDCGLLIHENRFTYAQRGLSKICDLGDWWEKETSASIPLGGICVRRSLGPQVAMDVQRLIVQSLLWARQRWPLLGDFVTRHAQEMDPEVMRKHINLYVNEHSLALGDTGRKSIRTFFEKAWANGIIKDLPGSLFLEEAH